MFQQGRKMNDGTKHLENIFKVFNPFNFIHDADEQRKYQDELKLQQMDPVQREAYLKKKSFEEEKAKMKAKRSYDVKKLKEKDRRMKLRMRRHDRKLKEIELRKQKEIERARRARNENRDDEGNMPDIKANGNISRNSFKSQTGPARNSKKHSKTNSLRQSKKSFGLSELPPLTLNGSGSVKTYNTRHQRRSLKTLNMTRFDTSVAERKPVQPKFMFRGENGMVMGTIEEYNEHKKAKEERRKERMKKRKEARKKREKEKRELEEKLLEDLMQRANEMFGFDQDMGMRKQKEELMKIDEEEEGKDGKGDKLKSDGENRRSKNGDDKGEDGDKDGSDSESDDSNVVKVEKKDGGKNFIFDVPQQE